MKPARAAMIASAIAAIAALPSVSTAWPLHPGSSKSADPCEINGNLAEVLDADVSLESKLAFLNDKITPDNYASIDESLQHELIEMYFEAISDNFKQAYLSFNYANWDDAQSYYKEAQNYFNKLALFKEALSPEEAVRFSELESESTEIGTMIGIHPKVEDYDWKILHEIITRADRSEVKDVIETLEKEFGDKEGLRKLAEFGVIEDVVNVYILYSDIVFGDAVNYYFAKHYGLAYSALAPLREYISRLREMIEFVPSYEKEVTKREALVEDLLQRTAEGYAHYLIAMVNDHVDAGFIDSEKDIEDARSLSNDFSFPLPPGFLTLEREVYERLYYRKLDELFGQLELGDVGMAELRLAEAAIYHDLAKLPKTTLFRETAKVIREMEKSNAVIDAK